MKITDLYEEDNFLTDKDEILKWMKKSFREFYPNKLIIDPDGLVYNGSLNLKILDTDHKLKVRFKSVNYNFYCNMFELISLEGCPQSVGVSFTCSSASLTSLKFCPQSIGKNFYCFGNLLADPKGYRFALYSEIGDGFSTGNEKINEIINTYKGADNRKHWPHAINLLSKVKL